MKKKKETSQVGVAVFVRLRITFCSFVSVCPCTRLQFTDKLNGANSTKPLLCVVAV